MKWLLDLIQSIFLVPVIRERLAASQAENETLKKKVAQLEAEVQVLQLRLAEEEQKSKNRSNMLPHAAWGSNPRVPGRMG